MRGGGCRCKGNSESNVRARRRWILGEGGSGCFGRVESGGKGEKRGKVEWEAIDSPWGVGEVCTVGVKNFSPFVSV